MADHHPLLINPPFPFPFPFIPFPSSHFHPPPPLMASKPLNPNADPFLSPSPPFLPPPPPPYVGASPVSGFGNLFYPRPPVPYFLQLHTYPALSCYNAWPLMITPPYPAVTLPCGGGAVPDTKPVLKTNYSGFRREFLVSCGPRNFTQNWVEKKISHGGRCGGDDPVEISGHSSVDDSGIAVTTVMIKNIPNQFKRRDLLQLLDRYCQVMNKQRASPPDSSVSEYDFVYLPMDFRRSWYEGKASNLGYAFVNFTTSMAASQFCAVYNNYKWDVNVNKKICEITQARIQGKEALKNAFKNKIFWCRTDQYLPVMLTPASNGNRRYRRVNVGKRIPCVPRKPLKKCVAELFRGDDIMNTTPF